jgi:hypothetical protein
MTPGKYLSKRNAAQWLDVSDKTIARLRAADELDWIPVGRRVRVNLASLEADAERQQQCVWPSAPPRGRLRVRASDEIRAAKAQARAAAAAARRPHDQGAERTPAAHGRA